MKIYKLLYDYENDTEFVNCDSSNLREMDEYIVSSGKTVEHWENIVLEYDSYKGKVLTDYIANQYRWLVVSDTFRKLTDGILEGYVQYLPVTITDKNKIIEPVTCNVANITTLVDAFDYENSKYDIFELDDEKIISVEKYALKGDEIGNVPIFRLKDDMIPVFVSEEIKSLIEDNGLKGFAFLEVDVG